MGRTRGAVFTILLLSLLAALPAVQLWRVMRQDQLDSALNTAVDRNDTALVRSLLRQGANANAPVLPPERRPIWKRIWDVATHRPMPKPYPTFSLLFKAVGWLPADGRHAISQGTRPHEVDNADTVRALVDAGADVNFRGGVENATPLIVATWFGKFESMKVLLEHAAKADVTDAVGDVPLISAAGGARADIVEYLIEHGADVDQVGRGGRTALLAAIGPRQFRSIDAVRDTVACLLRHHESIYDKDLAGNTAETLVRRFNDPELTRMLKRAGAAK